MPQRWLFSNIARGIPNALLILADILAVVTTRIAKKFFLQFWLILQKWLNFFAMVDFTKTFFAILVIFAIPFFFAILDVTNTINSVS